MYRNISLAVVKLNWNRPPGMLLIPIITGYHKKENHMRLMMKRVIKEIHYYWVTDYSRPKWEDVTVTYQESLSANVSVNTKQGILTDPKNPKESDRESRGSWSIIPYAQEHGLNPNEITKSRLWF